MTQPKKIALFYGHVASNIGDFAINSGTISLLRSVLTSANIDVVLIDADTSEYLSAAKSSFDDQGDIRFFNLKVNGEKAALYLRSPHLFFEEAGVADADIVLLSAGEHLFGYHHEENAKSLFWRILPAYAAKFLGKKCIQLPSTCGPFETDRTSALLSSLLELTDAFAVRDGRSLQLLKSRYSAEKPLLLDPAFFLDSPVGVQQLKQKHGVTALVMRSEGWGIRLPYASSKEQTERFKASGYEASKAFEFSLELAKRLLNTTDEVLRIFVQTAADHDLANELGKHLPEFLESGRLTIECPYSVQDYLGRLSEVDRVVSNRFHALILGMVVGRQSYGLYFDVHGHKIPGLFNLIEGMGHCQNLSRIEPKAAVTAVFNEISRENDAQQEALQKHIEKLRRDTVVWLNDAFQKPAYTVDAQQLLKAFVSLGTFSDDQLKASIEGNAKKQIDLTKKSAQAKRAETQRVVQQLEDELSEATAAHKAALIELKAISAEVQAKETRWAEQRQQLEGELSEATAAHKAALVELKAISAEVQAKETRWAEQRQQLQGELSEATAAHNATLVELKATSAEAQIEETRWAEQRQQLEGELSEAIAAHKAALVELKATSVEIQTKETRWAEQRQQLQGELSEATAAHKAALVELKATSAEIQAKETRWAEQKQQLQSELLETIAAHKAALVELKATSAEIQTKETRWAEQRQQLQGELSEATAAHKAALVELKSTSAKAQAKETRWAEQRQQLQGELSEATAAHKAALTEMKATSAEVQAKETQWAEQRQQLVGELVAVTAENQRLSAVNLAQLQALQLELSTTLANKMGKALIEGVGSPVSLVKLPFRLYKLWRESKSHQSPAVLGGESFSEVVSAYINGGFDAVESLLTSASFSPTITANAYTALARQLKSKDVNQACEAARLAYMADPRPFRRKWFAYRLSEAAQHIEAKALLDSLPSDMTFSKSEEARAKKIQDQAYQQQLGIANRKLDRHLCLQQAENTQKSQKKNSIPNLFSKFREALDKRDVLGAYAEYKRIKEVAHSGLLSSEQNTEFEVVCKERVCRLELLELADKRLLIPEFSANTRRICYVLHNSLPHSSGGYATRAHGVALGLKASGWDVIALTRPGYPLDMKPELSAEALETPVVIDGIEYVFTEKPMKRGTKLRKRGLDTDQYIVASVEALVERFIALKPAAVMAASNYLTALPALIAARRLGLPFIYEVRGFWEITSMSRRPDYASTIQYLVEQEMEAGVAKRADHVFTLTEPMREELIQRGVSKEKISLLPNSCDINEFLPRPRDTALAQMLKIPESVPVIGYIGTFVDYEGLEDLAMACGYLAKEKIEFRLLLIGNENVSGSEIGPIGRAIQNVTAECKYSDWLIMPGRVPKHEVANYYSLIDIAPFPRKPWPVCEMVSPMKPLEAMAMEKAVLASDVRALSEMIKQDVTGLLFRKGDITSLAAQLKRLIVDNELRRRLGSEGRKWVSTERTWDLTGKKADSVLARICVAKGPVSEKSTLKLDKELEIFRGLLAQAIDAGLSDAVIPMSANRVIYFLHGSFPHQSGGYASRTHGVVRSLLNAGYEILPYTRPSFPKDLNEVSMRTDFAAEDLVGGVTYRRIWADINRISQTETDYMLGSITPFEQVLRREKPAIVHCRSTYLIAAPALIAARRVGLPFVYEVSGLWELVYEARNTKGQHNATIQRMKALETFIIQNADALITLTEQMRDELISRGAKPEHIFMAPNSVDVNLFTPRALNEALKIKLGIGQNEHVVGYIGTIVDYEGLDDLVNAVARLIKIGYCVKILIVGSGSGPAQEIMLKNAIVATNMQDHVVMPGRVPHEEVFQYYSICDVLVYPRKPWGVCETVSPMKPFEAMALEKAVLVSDVKALRDITLDGCIGRLFEKGNLDSMVENLGALLQSPEERHRLGKAARTWVATNRSWDAAAKEIARAYRNAKSRIAQANTVMEPMLSKTEMKVSSISGLTLETKDCFDKKQPEIDIKHSSNAYPAWWDAVPSKFRARSRFVNVTEWKLSGSVIDLSSEYVSRFGEESVAKRIPNLNWQRADICSHIISNSAPSNVLDIGSGLGEFVNLFASTNPNVPISSVDVKDYSLWFDRTGRVERIYKSIFDLGVNEVRDVVTCFEVIEHLPPEKLAEAVGVLRSLAKRKLFVSVPFMESLPLYKGHFTRFDEANLLSLFPDAKFTIFGKGGKAKNKVHAWIMCEIDTAVA